jgi:hypothetical protein
MDVGWAYSSLESLSNDIEKTLADGELQQFDASDTSTERDFWCARCVMLDHLRKWGRRKAEVSPHDVPHYRMSSKLLHDFYKGVKAEAHAQVARVRDHNEVSRILRV